MGKEEEEEEDEDENRKLSDWLASSMADENLTAEDREIFEDWLMKESPERKKKRESESGLKITLHDVRELFSWLKARITVSDINERERKLFNEWLVQRVTDHQTDSPGELHKLKRELLD